MGNHNKMAKDKDPFELKKANERMKAEERSLYSAKSPPDTLSPRAKSTGHGKKTADKWNQ